MAAMLSFGLVALSSTVEPILTDSSKTMAMPEQIVKGDVLMTEGEFYIVKDITGHEVRLHVNKETKLDGTVKVKVGDKIEARVTPEGHATSITLQIQQNSTAPVVPGRPNIPSTVPQESAK
jgi:hypothetical protein